MSYLSYPPLPSHPCKYMLSISNKNYKVNVKAHRDHFQIQNKKSIVSLFCMPKTNKKCYFSYTCSYFSHCLVVLFDCALKQNPTKVGVLFETFSFMNKPKWLGKSNNMNQKSPTTQLFYKYFFCKKKPKTEFHYYGFVVCFWTSELFAIFKFFLYENVLLKDQSHAGFSEWGWTARNSIARQSFARHFWQEINCSTQNLSTARIQLILAKPDSSVKQLSLFFHSFVCDSKM